MNILLVDTSKTNRDYLKYIIKHWFAETIELNSLKIIEAYNAETTLHQIRSNSFDIVISGIAICETSQLDIVENIRNLDLVQQPLIYLTLSSNQHHILDKVLKTGIDGIMEKPADFANVGEILTHYLQSLKDENVYEIDEHFAFEEFEEFDEFESFDEFEDFESFDDNFIDKNMLDTFNLSHRQVPAVSFFQEKSDFLYIELKFVVILEKIKELIAEENQKSIYAKIDDIEKVMNEFVAILKTLPEFIELSTSVRIFSRLITRIEEDPTIRNNIDSKGEEVLSIYVTAILEDFIQWIENVFITKDANDIYYINASSLSSCIELESFIKKCMRNKIKSNDKG